MLFAGNVSMGSTNFVNTGSCTNINFYNSLLNLMS